MTTFHKAAYRAIASIIKQSESCEEIIKGLEILFQSDNPQFDLQRWRKAICK